jgi:catechol 2,3-dioxygenase-like lactoylglutathione lyase family enzyme
MDFLRARLRAPAGSLPELADFYRAQLGIEGVESTDEVLAIGVGASRLEFVPAEGQPFYHFALLAPGNRFAELLDWIGERTALLPDGESGDMVFTFSSWRAKAVYFHDPAGNIVELIAHRGIGETSHGGRFRAEELLGLSELGLVGDPARMAAELRLRVGLALWDGSVDGRHPLAFVGERAKTLILCRAGRPWLPTSRPAEPHPVEAVVSGPGPEGVALLEGSLYRIRRERPKGLVSE